MNFNFLNPKAALKVFNIGTLATSSAYALDQAYDQFQQFNNDFYNTLQHGVEISDPSDVSFEDPNILYDPFEDKYYEVDPAEKERIMKDLMDARIAGGIGVSGAIVTGATIADTIKKEKEKKAAK